MPPVRHGREPRSEEERPNMRVKLTVRLAVLARAQSGPHSTAEAPRGQSAGPQLKRDSLGGL